MASGPNDQVLKMKVFPKGQVVIPAPIRKQYNIQIGDQIDFIPSEDGILLKVSSTTGRAVTRTDRLFGVFRKQVRQNGFPDRGDINKSTEDGFAEGWRK